METEILKMRTELANSLRTFRKQKGITQAELAQACGVGNRTIERAEDARYFIGTKELFKILLSLNIKIQLTQ